MSRLIKLHWLLVYCLSVFSPLDGIVCWHNWYLHLFYIIEVHIKYSLVPKHCIYPFLNITIGCNYIKSHNTSSLKHSRTCYEVSSLSTKDIYFSFTILLSRTICVVLFDYKFQSVDIWQWCCLQTHMAIIITNFHSVNLIFILCIHNRTEEWVPLRYPI